MSTTLKRGLLTDILLTTMASGTAKPVGDTVIPPGGGWAGHPNASNWMPYTILSPLSATRSSGPLAHSQSEWQMPYAITAYGIRRDQCELMADNARVSLETLVHTVLNLSDHYKVQQIQTVVIGMCGPPDFSTDPPIWKQNDQVTIWLTKELT